MTSATEITPDEARVNRRALLRRSGVLLAGAAGATAVQAVAASSASANPGDPVIQGQANDALATTTSLTSSATSNTVTLANTAGGTPLQLAPQADFSDNTASGGVLSLGDQTSAEMVFMHSGGAVPDWGIVRTDLNSTQTFPIDPVRALDTRIPDGRANIVAGLGNLDSTGRLRGGTEIAVSLRDVAFFAEGVFGNLTVNRPLAPGHATLWPGGVIPRPITSSVNWVTNQTVANFFFAGVAFEDPDGFPTVRIWVHATTFVILDITAVSTLFPEALTGTLPANQATSTQASTLRQKAMAKAIARRNQAS